MKVDAILSASRQFVRTREAVHAAPSIRGLIRHIEANMRLYEAFIPEGSATWLVKFVFAVYRASLVLTSDVKSCALRLVQWFQGRDFILVI